MLNANIGSQEIPGITGKFGLGVKWWPWDNMATAAWRGFGGLGNSFAKIALEMEVGAGIVTSTPSSQHGASGSGRLALGDQWSTVVPSTPGWLSDCDETEETNHGPWWISFPVETWLRMFWLNFLPILNSWYSENGVRLLFPFWFWHLCSYIGVIEECEL